MDQSGTGNAPMKGIKASVQTKLTFFLVFIYKFIVSFLFKVISLWPESQHLILSFHQLRSD